ncbi:dienelactone hydrolase family protein [Streptomyces sp. NRRL F-5123]|uniref:dienelactone hydrolase family protein n=1 Tax=Streptomyces sp. NRRL F-5123 TaxID=1463856 RepID=UPI0004E13633|nr:alpha/beta hydrolase [Streptomyces sp. NRRL F-5123]
MRFTLRPESSAADGVRTRQFLLGDIPGVLWTPDGAGPGSRPLVLVGHGGGQHKEAPLVTARAERFVRECGFAVAAVDVPGHGERPTDPELDALATANGARIAAGAEPYPLIADFQGLVARRTVPEWRAVLDALQGLDDIGAGPVGYWGVSLGCGLGVPFAAAEPRVRAAVLGLSGARALAQDAARVTVPVRFLLAWDDERIPRAEGLALFDAFGSADKSLHAHPGPHSAPLPADEPADAARFFARHLG